MCTDVTMGIEEELGCTECGRMNENNANHGSGSDQYGNPSHEHDYVEQILQDAQSFLNMGRYWHQQGNRVTGNTAHNYYQAALEVLRNLPVQPYQLGMEEMLSYAQIYIKAKVGKIRTR